MTNENTAKERVILHCDCNCFFASVEMVGHPKLATVPMAVAGNQADRHGIILAKNELAKKYNVQTAETIWSARKKCPSLVLVPPHYHLYIEYSRKVRAILGRFTDLVEPFGIDECWLDVTGSRRLFGDGLHIAEQIRRTVREELGITVSIGVSYNKVFAKMGSDYRKPDAITVITKENFRTLLWPLPVETLFFVGNRTAESLHRMGIATIGELASLSRPFLENRFGRHGVTLYEYSNGLDTAPVQPATAEREAKSVSNGLTFNRDITSERDAQTAIEALSELVAARLRRDSQLATTVSLTMKDPMLRTVSRQGPLQPPTMLAREIAVGAMEQLRRLWHPGAPIRSLTVAATNLMREKDRTEQLSLFDGDVTQRRERDEKLESALADIRQRFGSSSVRTGAYISSDFGLQHPSRHEEDLPPDDEP